MAASTRDTITIRVATLDDVPALQALIVSSARELCRQDYTDVQIEAALRSAWGVDTQLIADGTYFVAEARGEIVACGGWGRRKTLFGGDRNPDRSAAELDPAHDAARIRAFFVRPDWARHGIGAALLDRCETEARKAGFRSVELFATLTGWRLYRRRGYVGDERRTYEAEGGVALDFIPMRKSLL